MTSSHRKFGSLILPRFALLAPSALVATTYASFATAQVPPPPLPPSESESSALDAAADDPSVETTAGTEGALEIEPAAPTSTSDSAAQGQPEAGAMSGEATGTGEPAQPAPAAVEMSPAAIDEAETTEQGEVEQWFRLDSTRRQPSLNGSTGLLHLEEAGSGEVGTFRVQMLAGFYSSKGFLCSSSFPCFDQVTGEATLKDKAQRSAWIANLSVTPFSFLEAFATIKTAAAYNSEGTPQSLQVVGDTNIGIKGFMPQKADRIFKAGATADLYFLTGTGGVGLAGGATSFALRGLATLDLNNRSVASKRIPLRAHFNLGYFFDNSAKLVEELEETPPPEGRGEPITRIERYGLGISRVDSLELGLGTEYIHPYFRPFIEWTLDAPVNRQKYVCVITDTVNERTSSGDQCLKLAGGLASSPSRLSFGTRVFPWQATGLALSLAADIGTGGVHRFLDETRPETPYTIWFGLGYTVDVAPKVAVAAVITPTAPAVETRRYVMGRVIDEKSGAGVPDAIVRYKDVPMTGLIASGEGLFISQDLPPGEYVFAVQAKDYMDGICAVQIPDAVQSAGPVADATQADATAVTPNPEEPYVDADGNVLVPLDCKLTELPPVANVTGLLVDGRNGGPVSDATVTIVDQLNRSLSLQVDNAGAFQFRNLPFGSARLRATAPGYLPTIHPINVTSREELKPHVLMNPRPKRLGVTVTKTEVKLDRRIEFVGETTELVLDSAAMIEELSVALAESTDIESIEIQVHTDDSGAASYSRRLTQERADYIRTLLIDLGVKPGLLTSKGYGPDQPLSPNVSDESRAKNNRVQFIIVKK